MIGDLPCGDTWACKSRGIWTRTYVPCNCEGCPLDIPTYPLVVDRKVAWYFELKWSVARVIEENISFHCECSAGFEKTYQIIGSASEILVAGPIYVICETNLARHGGNTTVRGNRWMESLSWVVAWVDGTRLSHRNLQSAINCADNTFSLAAQTLASPSIQHLVNIEIAYLSMKTS